MKTRLVIALLALSTYGISIPAQGARNPPTPEEVKAYCDGRLERQIKVRGSCTYTFNDGVYQVCLNFIGWAIPRWLMKLGCSESDTGFRRGVPCEMEGVSRICARSPKSAIWAERVDYRPIPPDADEDCETDEQGKAILCLFY